MKQGGHHESVVEWGVGWVLIAIAAIRAWKPFPTVEGAGE